MLEDIVCPFCDSTHVKRLDGIVSSRYVEDPAGGRAVERMYPVYRCLSCGKSFDIPDLFEVHEPEEDDLLSNF
ncbi:MAG: hypothetical protein PHI34_03535 [Acidobacteriota bacterium]|nr:hypothetical protein [Acidobacteriota bacterium]